MIKDKSHICIKCNSNENSIRSSEWEVKGEIFIDNHFTSASSYHWVCLKCLYLWDQYHPEKGDVFDPDINKKEKANYKKCGGCGNPRMYCTCF